MGMYDNVHYKGKEYQSKSFYCTLAAYKIEDDKLWLETYRNLRTGDTQPWGWGGDLERIGWSEAVMDFFVFGFYDDADEYRALALDGRIKEVRRLNDGRWESV